MFNEKPKDQIQERRLDHYREYERGEKAVSIKDIDEHTRILQESK